MKDSIRGECLLWKVKKLLAQVPLSCHLPSSFSEATQVTEGELVASYPARHKYATTAPKVRCTASPDFALEIVGSVTGQKPFFSVVGN